MIRIGRLIPIILASPLLFGQPNGQFTPDSLTRGLWHLNELGGNIVSDTSVFWNHGIANGTSIVQGRFGNARFFNGTSDYVSIPSSSSLDLGNSSFTIDAWFKTTGTEGVILRRGITNVPGYMLSIHLGRVSGMIGNRADGTWPDTVIAVISNRTVNDGVWHHATFVRDRSSRSLSLLIDGELSASPIDDSLAFPLVNEMPLAFGCWINAPGYPPQDFFSGSIDEVRIRCEQPYSGWLVITVVPLSLDFGVVRLQTTDSLSLTVKNAGSRDTLHVSSVTSNNSVFLASAAGLIIPPGGASTLTVQYTPTKAGIDTGSIAIASNDPLTPVTYVRVSGKGFTLANQPFIKSITHPLGTYGQARLVWYRSVLDTVGAADPVVQYSIWRRVNGTDGAPGSSSLPSNPSSRQGDPLWDFVATLPAVQFDEYSALVPLAYGYSYSSSWNVFVVASHTSSNLFYFSDPDSTQYYPLTSVHQSTDPVPEGLHLYQNYPNPFNPETRIGYEIPKDTRDGSGMTSVTLAVYDVLGRNVATLVNERQTVGMHEAVWDARGISSGTYFCRLEAAGRVRTVKMFLLK